MLVTEADRNLMQIEMKCIHLLRLPCRTNQKKQTERNENPANKTKKQNLSVEDDDSDKILKEALELAEDYFNQKQILRKETVLTKISARLFFRISK